LLKDKSEIVNAGTARKYWWSPDGKSLAYEDRGFGVFELETQRIKLHPWHSVAQQNSGAVNDLGPRSEVSSFLDPVVDPAWSPDSKWIAGATSLERTKKDDGSEVLVLGDNDKIFLLDVHQETKTITELKGIFPQWSANGRQLFFYNRKSDSLWTASFENGSFSNAKSILASSYPQYRSLSSDLRRILLDDGFACTVIDIDSGRKVFECAPALHAGTSPNGEFIFGSGLGNGLWMHDFASGKFAKLLAGDSYQYEFSRDGEWVAVTRFVGDATSGYGNWKSIDGLVFKTATLRSKLLSAGIPNNALK
jgi:hypothetical protein